MSNNNKIAVVCNYTLDFQNEQSGQRAAMIDMQISKPLVVTSKRIVSTLSHTDAQSKKIKEVLYTNYKEKD